MRAAIDAGKNFSDNRWDYRNVRSERLMGRTLANGNRQLEEAEHIDSPLNRHKTDYVDLTPCKFMARTHVSSEWPARANA